MKKSKRAVTALAAAGLLLSTLAPGVAFATAADPGDPDQAPNAGTYVAGGNTTSDDCAEFSDGFRDGDAENGSTYDHPDGELSVTYVKGDGFITVTPGEGFDVRLVRVKAGNGYNEYVGDDLSGQFLSPKSDSVSNWVVCYDETPVVEPETQVVTYSKSWDGDTDQADLDNVTVTFDVKIGEERFTLGDGEASQAFPVTTSFELIGENVAGLPEACTWERTSSTTTDDGRVDVNNTVDCDEPVEAPEYSVEFTKTWAGDDIGFDDHDVTFIVNGDDWNIGDPAAPVELGDELTVTEETTSLPDNCEYTTDLDSPITIVDDGTDHKGVFTIDVINTVDCAEVGDNAFFNLSFTKEWMGDTELADIDSVSVEFDITIDGVASTVADGEVITVAGRPDEVDVELVDEHVSGLPDTCDWELAGLSLVESDDLDVTVTNEVDCAEVKDLVTEKPKTPPYTTPVVAPVAPVVTGWAPVTPVVTGKAPVAPVEVKGVSMTAGDQEMPRTGVPALLLSLMGMTALGTGGMMVRRRP